MNIRIELSNGILELGPILSKAVVWKENTELKQLNASLPKGEAEWRRPTKDEFGEIGEPIRRIWAKARTCQEKMDEINKYLEGLGLPWNSNLWSDAEFEHIIDYAWYFNTYLGAMCVTSKAGKTFVLCVRSTS